MKQICCWILIGICLVVLGACGKVDLTRLTHPSSFDLGTWKGDKGINSNEWVACEGVFFIYHDDNRKDHYFLDSNGCKLGHEDKNLARSIQYLQLDLTSVISEIDPHKLANHEVYVEGTMSKDVKGSYNVVFTKSIDILPSTTRSNSNNKPQLCKINPNKELLILDPTITNSLTKPWSFSAVVRNIVRVTQGSDNRQNINTFIRSWFAHWKDKQIINGHEVPAADKEKFFNRMIDPWLLPDGDFDLSLAPFDLLAITNRMDLATENDAGEGRFVFGLNGGGRFTVIFEYKLPISRDFGKKEWAQLWHKLGRFEIGSRNYEIALAQVVKTIFIKNRVIDGDLTIRTNEIAFNANGQWELREFRWDRAELTGKPIFRQHTVAGTATNKLRTSEEGKSKLIQWMLENEEDVLSMNIDFPDVYIFREGLFEGEKERMAGGRAITLGGNPDPWVTISDQPDGFKSADKWETMVTNINLNSCNGCHATDPVNGFYHIAPKNDVTQPAEISPFLANEVAVQGIRFNSFRCDLGCNCLSDDIAEIKILKRKPIH